MDRVAVRPGTHVVDTHEEGISERTVVDVIDDETIPIVDELLEDHLDADRYEERVAWELVGLDVDGVLTHREERSARRGSRTVLEPSLPFPDGPAPSATDAPRRRKTGLAPT